MGDEQTQQRHHEVGGGHDARGPADHRGEAGRGGAADLGDGEHSDDDQGHRCGGDGVHPGEGRHRLGRCGSAPAATVGHPVQAVADPGDAVRGLRRLEREERRAEEDVGGGAFADPAEGADVQGSRTTTGTAHHHAGSSIPCIPAAARYSATRA